jgi:hypothetical protein
MEWLLFGILRWSYVSFSKYDLNSLQSLYRLMNIRHKIPSVAYVMDWSSRWNEHNWIASITEKFLILECFSSVLVRLKYVLSKIENIIFWFKNVNINISHPIISCFLKYIIRGTSYFRAFKWNSGLGRRWTPSIVVCFFKA